MTDIDLLIKKEDLEKANKVLNSLEYVNPPYYDDFLRNHQNLSINTLMYRSPCHLHLHWHRINSTWPLISG